jgi:DNA-binding response OmpR family regulator
MGEKVLVIDDDEATVWLVATLLKHHGFDVIEAVTAEDGLKRAKEERPDLVLLDIMMPYMDGWEVCRRLREVSEMPIIFLTAKSSVNDVVFGLGLGADDYVIKPFDNQELVARVRAHLRRSPANQQADELAFDSGNLAINFPKREVRLRGDLVELTPKEFELLSVLARNAGRVLTRGELADQVWGPNYSGANESLKLYIHYLRKKIEPNPAQPAYILTARGVGYRFTDKQDEAL